MTPQLQWKKKFFNEQCPRKHRSANLMEFPESLRELGKRWAENPFSLYIYGSWGTGKTHFAFALIKEMFDRSKRFIWPRYFTSTNLDAKLLECCKGDRSRAELEYISDRQNEDILFIDDIGRETNSDRIKRQYFEILNHRYENELPTLLTSNYSPDMLGGVLDPAISSRLQEWEVLLFQGKDRRKQEVPNA